MPNRPALADTVEVIDPMPYWAQLETRFGIPPSTFDGFVLVRPQSKKLHLVPEHHSPPVRPEPESIGLPFLRINMAVPKLTTAAAMQFGMQATRNVIDATTAQATAYLARENLTPSADQLARCTGRGYVIIRYGGWGVGVGFLDDDPDEAPTVQSMFPKGWTRDVAL